MATDYQLKSNKLKFLNVKQTQQHPFHLLSSSKLPILTSILAGSLALTFIAKLHSIDTDNIYNFSLIAGELLEPLFSIGSLHYTSPNVVILYFLAFLFLVMWSWSLSLFKESTREGHHTLRVQTGLKYGMLLFLVSEAMLFFPFF